MPPPPIWARWRGRLAEIARVYGSHMFFLGPRERNPDAWEHLPARADLLVEGRTRVPRNPPERP
jgi:hypothetical protein